MKGGTAPFFFAEMDLDCISRASSQRSILAQNRASSAANWELSMVVPAHLPSTVLGRHLLRKGRFNVPVERRSKPPKGAQCGW